MHPPHKLRRAIIRKACKTLTALGFCIKTNDSKCLFFSFHFRHADIILLFMCVWNLFVHIEFIHMLFFLLFKDGISNKKKKWFPTNWNSCWLARLIDTKCTLHMFVLSIYPLINLVFVCSFVVITTANYFAWFKKKRHNSHISNCRRPFAGNRCRYFWCSVSHTSVSKPWLPKILDVCPIPFFLDISFRMFQEFKFVISEGDLWLSVSECFRFYCGLCQFIANYDSIMKHFFCFEISYKC